MAEEILDALVLAARYDEQGLAASGRRVINQVEEVSRASARAVNATGQANPFSGVSRDLITATRDFRNGTLSLEGYNVALQQARSELRAFADQGLQPAKRQIAAVNAAIDQTTNSLARQDAATAKVNPGMRRFAGNMAVVAASSIGVSSAVGSAAQSVLFMSLGMGNALAPIAALSAAVLAGSFAYDRLTDSSRKAREEQDKLVEAGRRRLRGPDETGLSAEAAASAQRVSDINREILKIQREENQALRDPAFSLANQYRLRVLNRDLAEAQLQADELGLQVVRQFDDAERSRIDAKRSLISALGRELAVLQIGERAVRRLETATTGGPGASAILGRIQGIEDARQATKDAEAAQRAETEAIEAAIRAYDQFLSALKRFNDERAEELKLARETRITSLAPRGLDASIEGAFESAAEGARDLVTPADLAAASAERMQDAFDDMAGAVDVLSAVGDALGFIDDQGQQALNSVQNLIAAAATGNVAGAIVAGVGLLSAAFGKDATQLEHERIQRENTDAIERNTAALQAAETAGGRAAAQQALGDLDPDLRQLLEIVAKQPVGIDAAKTLDNALLQTGSSLRELQAVAEANGIRLLDSEGRLVAGSLAALDEQLRQAADAATHFRDDLDSRARIREVEDKLGIGGRSTDPGIAAVERARDNLVEGLSLDPATEERIKALDLATVAGREAFLAFERDLFERARAGGITQEELDKFASVDELADALGEGADAVNALSDAANQATKGLSNIPDTFKLASAEFAARAVDSPVLPALRGTSFSPGLRGTDGSLLPQTQVTGNTIVIQLPALPKNATVQDQARAVADELELRAIGTFGLAPAP